VYRENWTAESDEFIEELLARFRKKLEHPGAKLHVVRMNEILLAFMIEVPHEEEGVELSALNTNPLLKVTEPGLLLFESVVEKRVADQTTVHLDAPAKNAQIYINKHGFVGTGVIDFAGVPLVLATRDDSLVYSREVINKTVPDARAIPAALREAGEGYGITRMRVKDGGIELALARPTDEQATS
jgi:hypothetical protein